MFKKRSIALFIANFITVIFLLQLAALLTDISALEFMKVKATVSEQAPEVLDAVAAASSNMVIVTLVFSGVSALLSIVSFWARNYLGAWISAASFIASVITFSIMANFVYPIGFVGWIVIGLLFTIYGAAQQLLIAKPKKEKKQ